MITGSARQETYQVTAPRPAVRSGAGVRRRLEVLEHVCGLLYGFAGCPHGGPDAAGSRRHAARRGHAALADDIEQTLIGLDIISGR
jgi:hypothetical protein